MNFPIKVGNETDVEKYAKTLIKGEEQLLITRNGKQFLTNGKGGYITINTGTVTGGGGSECGNASIDDTKKSTTTTYSSEKIENITGDINDDGLDVSLKGKSLQEQIKQVFTYANSNKDGKLLIGNAIGRDYTNLSYVSISNDIIKQKQDIVNALSNKGVVAELYNDLGSYADKINSIIQHPTIKNTKLNVTAPLTKELKLTNPTKMDSLCISVLEYQSGKKDIVKYNCAFDNGDSSNFTNTTNMIFDGVMKQDMQIKKFHTNLTRTEKDFTEYIADIDISSFYKINNFEFEEDATTGDTINVKGTHLPNLVFGKDDINLTGVDKLSKLEWKATNNGNNYLKMIVSVDSGVTWFGYNSITKTVEKVDIKNNEDVKNKGLSIDEVNNLTTEDLNKLRGDSPKIRFGYYFDIEDINNKTYNDNITLSVDMYGVNVHSKNYDYELDADGTTVKVKLSKDGTYTIIYCDND